MPAERSVPPEPRDQAPAVLLSALLGAFALYQARLLWIALQRDTPHPFGDFFALWSYAHIAAGHGAAVLYDWDALHAAQVGLGMDPAVDNPFPYPPTFLFLLWPLSCLPYYPAFAAWSAATFAAFAAAVLAGRRSPADAPAGPALIGLALVALLAPSSSVMVVFGQGGFLVAALLTGGMRLSRSHPVWGGVLLGLLTCKPQFGVLVPFALLAAGRWRCIAAACATTALLGLAATTAFGWDIWAAWIDLLPRYQRRFDAMPDNWQLMPTVQANLELLGAPPILARAAQLGASCAMAAVAWACFRSGPRGFGVPALLAGTLLATPHAFVYELPLLTGAAILLADRCLRSGGLDGLEWAAIALALFLPALMLADGPRLPVSAPVLLLFLVTVLRRRSAARSEGRAHGSPACAEPRPCSGA